MPLQSDSSRANSAAKSGDVLALLDAKCAELDAYRQHLMDQLANTEREMELIKGTIQLFTKSMQTSSLPVFMSSPLRMLPDFRRGEIRETAVRVLREAAHPLSSQEIGRIICTRKSLSMGKEYFENFCMRITGSLRSAERMKLVHAVGRAKTGAILWFSSEN